MKYDVYFNLTGFPVVRRMSWLDVTFEQEGLLVAEQLFSIIISSPIQNNFLKIMVGTLVVDLYCTNKFELALSRKKP